MFNRDTWTEIWATIKSNKLRSILTAFGVFWGIFILVIMLGSSKGFENGVRKNFEGVATNSAFMWSQASSIPYKGYNAGRRWDITNEDINGIRTLDSDLKLIAPRLTGNSGNDNVVYGDLKGSYSVFGDYPEFFKIMPIEVLEGRILNDRDIAETRKVCVIGQKIKEEIFKNENPINKDLRVNGVYFKVIGVIKPRTSNMNIGSNPVNTVFIPLTTLQKTYGYGNEVHFFGITAKEGVKITKLEEKIKKYLLKKHDLSPEDMKAVGGFNMQEMFDQVEIAFKGVKWLSWIVGIGTLLAGIIGVSNIMLIIIRERTKEIGIKRALGAQSRIIRRQILFESALLTVFAGFTGLFFSVLILELVGMITQQITKDAFILFVPAIGFGTAILSLIILITGGVLAGLIPASKAIRIKPIDALRDE